MSDDATRFRKGVELLKAGHFEEAIGELEVAATTGEDLPIEHFALAVAYAKAAEPLRAVEEFERFLAMDPRDAKKIEYANKQLGKLRKRLEREGHAPTQELSSMPAPPAAPPDAPEPTPAEAGPTAASATTTGETLRAFENAVATGRDTPSAWSGLGKTAFRKGLETAISAFEKAIALDPAFADAHFNLGLVATVAGDPARARRCFERVLELRPDDDEARVQLDRLAT